MMRVLRALAFLAVGLLLGGVSVYSIAETIPAQGVPAVYQWRAWEYSTSTYIYGTPGTEAQKLASPDFDYLCPRHMQGTRQWNGQTGGSGYTRYCYYNGGYEIITLVYRCESGANPNKGYCGLGCPNSSWTLSGATCTRPDCVAPNVRDPADGICKPPACPTGQTKSITQFSGKWAVCSKQQASCLTGTLNTNSTWCDGSCEYSMSDAVNQGWADSGSSVDNPKPVYWTKTGTSTGVKCSQPTNNDPGAPPVVPQKAPPCAAGEGVLTTSTGTVKCVPEATPGNPPKTSSTKTTQETETDLKETTCTNTTDPVSGAVNKNCTTVTTPKAPGSTPTTATKSTDVPANPSTPGKAGPDNSGNEPGQCEKEPDSPMCKKGTPKEKGQLPGIGTAEADLVQAKADLTAKFNEVKTAASQMFGTVGASGGGSLPCPPPVVIMGKPISFCLTQYESTISMIGGGVMFIAAILSAFIILL